MEAIRESLQECPAIKSAPPFPAKAGNLPPGDDREGAADTGSNAGPFRVLVVEDDPLLMALYTLLLRKKNLPADQCADGGDALKKLSAMVYDLVILDINLPGLDGISLAQWLQHHRPATRTVVISGDASPGKIQAAMRAGSRDYLLKPFTIQQFGEMIDRLNQPRSSAKEKFDDGQQPFHVPFPGNANPPA